jgi:hypothetical protein
MFPWTRHEPATERERYLEYELERERDAARRREQEADEQRAARRREWREASEREWRTASDWPEALRKQAYLFAREFDPTDEFQWFEHGAAACDRALVIWTEVAAAKQAELDALRAQIAAVQHSIRLEVADRLEAEATGRAGWRMVAVAIREEEPERWLDW